MAERLSTGARTAALDSGIHTTFDGGTLNIYSGSQPASADDAPSGTLGRARRFARMADRHLQ